MLFFYGGTVITSIYIEKNKTTNTRTNKKRKNRSKDLINKTDKNQKLIKMGHMAMCRNLIDLKKKKKLLFYTGSLGFVLALAL